MTITEEEFEAWKVHPVTTFFLRAFQTTAKLTEFEWKEGSWNSGNADQAALDRLKSKYEAYYAVYKSSYFDVLARQNADFTDIEARQEDND